MASMAIEQIEAGEVQPDHGEILSKAERVFNELMAEIDSVPAEVIEEVEITADYKPYGRGDGVYRESS